MAKVSEIERVLEEAALPGLLVEDTDGRVMISGIVNTEDERQRALELARDTAGRTVEDNIEVSGVVPATIEDLESELGVMETEDRDLSEVESGAFPGATEGFEETSLEPGDFAGDENTTTSSWVSSGPTSAIDEDIVSEGDVVFSPPTDPVVARNPNTGRTEVVGGLSSSSMESLHVDRSALDGEYGDEAIADAVRRELLEDAATTGLDLVEVSVFEGVVRLTGRVELLQDAENAEEVASRVPGVVEVREELEVSQYER